MYAANTKHQMLLANQFKEHINKNLPFLKENKLLVAISGGVDSVVLTHLLCDLGFEVSLAHCNFNLRAEESDADENFVLDLDDKLDLEVFIESFDTNAFVEANKLSIQLAARQLRYDWFQSLVEQLNFDYVLTAHHADDNLETFLINLSRGTGLDGLTGIPEINNYIIRPLLPFSRETIERYARDKNITWREDSSNQSNKYLRNALRHEVIPKLKQLNATFLENFNKTQAYLQESKTIIQDRVDEVYEQVVDKISDEDVYFNIEKIQQLSNPKAYLYQLLNAYGFTEWDDVFHLLSAQSGKQVFSKKHILLKDRDYLILSEKKAEQQDVTIVIENDIDQQTNTPFGTIKIETVTALAETNPKTLYVDKSLLKFPLNVRIWQKGDYFYPLGMPGKKKLSKFFKDEKLSLLDKERILVLISGKEIVWVIGKRPDDRFKVTAKTQHILKIQLSN